MIILSGEEEKEATKFVDVAAKVALESTCTRAHCGAVIVKDGKIIGKGYNSPPLEDENNRMCENVYLNKNGKKQKYDKTCCIHAEWRAIIDALKTHPKDIKDSTMYFMRIEDDNPTKTEPFCTVCSRLIMEVGIANSVLWQEEGYIEYSAPEYNQASYDFFK
jgi:dCMP deaminase